MGIFEQTPSIRADTEAFNKALRELGLTKKQFMRKLTKLGVNLGDQRSKTNYLNKLLRDAGKSEIQYKNVISSKPSKRLTTKGKVEVSMGGSRPGAVGAPKNAKIWNDGTKIQKTAIKKFPNSVTKQRQYFVDTMKKIYGKIPKKKILETFKNTIKGIKTASPMGIMSELAMDMIEKNPELMNILPTNQNAKPMTFNEGGMMDIDYMTRPLGMQAGGDPIQERKDMMQKAMTLKEGQRRADMATGDPEMETASTYGNMNMEEFEKLAITIAQQQGDSSEENIRQIMRQLSAVLPSLQQDMSNERRSPIASGISSLIDMFGLNKKTNLDRDVSQYRVK